MKAPIAILLWFVIILLRNSLKAAVWQVWQIQQPSMAKCTASLLNAKLPLFVQCCFSDEKIYLELLEKYIRLHFPALSKQCKQIEAAICTSIFKNKMAREPFLFSWRLSHDNTKV